MRRLTFALVLGLALAAGTALGDYYTGVDAFERGDYEKALRAWQPLAEEGDVEAQYRVARMFEQGLGTEKDPSAAADWYRRAADHGHARAQNNLGRMLELGLGVPQDPTEAARWYRRAADQGRSVAQANAARLYLAGIGVERNAEQAALWYRGAAEQGHAESQFQFGELLRRGVGVEPDTARAVKWYRRAGKQDHIAASITLGAMYRDGDGVEVDLQKSLRWLRKAAALGSADADSAIDTLLAGPSVRTAEAAPQDDPPTATRPRPVADAPVEAETDASPTERPALLLRGESGTAEDRYELGRAYLEGQHGLPLNRTEAEQWLGRAAREGHSLAIYRLAFLYLRGEGASDEPDYVQAAAWFQIGANREIGDTKSWLERTRKRMTREERARTEETVERLLSEMNGAP